MFLCFHDVVIFLSIVYVLSLVDGDGAPTLKLVHVIFRHGDRTTEQITIYPNDPHKNFTYPPYGQGELTNRGEERQFKLGDALRRRYSEFWGNSYTPDLLEATSSFSNRTKMSLELLLSGAFPPTKDLTWNHKLSQPIPFFVIPKTEDKIFLASFTCPNFDLFYEEAMSTDNMKVELHKYRQLFKYLSTHTGLEIESFVQAAFIYFCLLSEHEWGLPLPLWTRIVYPEPLRTIAVKFSETISMTSNLKRLNSGYLLKKILDDSQGKISGKLVPEGRRVFFYSGHDANVAALLGTLGIFDPHLIPYGAYILMELHKIDSQYGFKIYYHNYSSPEPRLMKLPQCDDFCPFDEFVDLYEQYLPLEDTCGNVNVM